MGKGRTIAGLIYENTLRRRCRSLWLTSSPTLFMDAKRDYADVAGEAAADAQLFQLGKNDKDELNNRSVGTLFMTYAALRQGGKVALVINWLGGGSFDGIVSVVSSLYMWPAFSVHIFFEHAFLRLL